MKFVNLKIANGEEIPKKIKVFHKIWEYDKSMDYKNIDGDYLFDSYIDMINEDLNIKLEIIEDTPKEEKKIEDKARFQYSQIPSWFDIKEVIKAVNNNFEVHQQALNKIIDKINGE